jgi:zinc protease
VTAPLASLNKRWAAKKVAIPSYKTPAAPAKGQVYFYDVPGAVQSVLRIGYPALAQTDKDFYPAVVMNYILGGGGFASRLTQELAGRQRLYLRYQLKLLGHHVTRAVYDPKRYSRECNA